MYLLQMALSSLFVLGLSLLFGWLIHRYLQHKPDKRKKLLLHSINRDLCIGCGKCVARCPTDVLGLDEAQKSHIRPKNGVPGGMLEDCIECQQCMTVCPTPNKALVMHPREAAPPTIAVPDLDEFYQSRRFPGLYLIGEAAGKPMIKNGVNLGRVVVEHMLVRGGLTPSRRAPMVTGAPAGAEVDVVIVGAGPAGLSAAMTCVRHGLSYAILERKSETMSTVMSYPSGKDIHANPPGVRCVGLLPVWDCRPKDLQEEWTRILNAAGVTVYKELEARQVTALAQGGFQVATSRPPGFRARRVVLALGGSQPRLLGGKEPLPGEELVEKRPEQSERYRGQSIVVIGAGDSAVETALDLAGRDNQVVMMVRGAKSEMKASAKNLQKLEEAQQLGWILPEFEAVPLSFLPGRVRLKRKSKAAKEELQVDKAFACIGGAPPKQWLEDQIATAGWQKKDPSEKPGLVYVPVRHDQFSLPATDVLLERLIGPQPALDQPGPAEPEVFRRWLAERLGRDVPPALIQAPWELATVVGHGVDLDRGPPPPPAPMPPEIGVAAAVTMRFPADRFITRMPERIRVEELRRPPRR